MTHLNLSSSDDEFPPFLSFRMQRLFSSQDNPAGSGMRNLEACSLFGLAASLKINATRFLSALLTPDGSKRPERFVPNDKKVEDIPSLLGHPKIIFNYP